MEHPRVPLALDLPDVSTEARDQRTVEGNDSTARCILEPLLRVPIRDPDRDRRLVHSEVLDPELCDLFGSGSGRHE